MAKRKIKLGDKVRDKITGFEGVAVSKIEFLNQCVQYNVQPPVSKEGKWTEGEYIDEQQLIVVKPAKPKKESKAKKTGGGFRNYPIRR